jgi:hypothetical protein
MRNFLAGKDATSMVWTPLRNLFRGKVFIIEHIAIQCRQKIVCREEGFVTERDQPKVHRSQTRIWENGIDTGSSCTRNPSHPPVI